MNQHVADRLRPFAITSFVGGALLLAGSAAAQPGGFGPGPGPGNAGASPREAAPVDLTGYWVSLVTEDWIERMSPDSPPSGTGGGFGGFGGGGGASGASGPGAAGAAVPEVPCRAYAAGGSLRVPGRVHITWVDDSTLQVEMDAGSQTRVFHFAEAEPPAEGRSLQGHSVAEWEVSRGRGRGGFGGGGGAQAPQWGKLKVVTTHLSGGYLLSSRSEYSADAVLTEYFTHHENFADEYFTVTAVIDDNGQRTIASSTFKKEPDGSKFAPTGCEIMR